MSYEKLPEIPDVDYKSIKLERLTVAPADADIDEALGNLAENVQNFDTKKGKAADGDQVVIDFKGLLDGEPFDGGAAEDYPLVLGSNSFIPGFEEQLIGAKKGEEKKLDVTFPEEYGAEHLAGKAVVFEVTVKEVKKPVPAEIDDEMAKKYGAEDLAALKGQISERLQAEFAGAARAVMKRKLLDQLDEKVSFELPPALVEAEAAQIAHQLWHEENPRGGRPRPPRDRSHRRARETGRAPGEAGSSAGRAGPEERHPGLRRRDVPGDHGAGAPVPGSGTRLLRVRAEERGRAAADPRAALRGQGRRFRLRDVRDHRKGGLQGRSEGRRGRARGRVIAPPSREGLKGAVLRGRPFCIGFFSPSGRESVADIG
jgi:hypothetical protein